MLAPLLQCPACDQIITHPTTLICGHTVCSKHVLLTPTEGAASHLEPDTSDSTNPQPAHTPLPSCPILTCYTPGGARPLRRRDTPIFTSSQSHPDDPVFPPVIYMPPPNDQFSTRHPPPPLAKVKIPHPRIDVTLKRVLDVLGRFVDLRVEPEILASGPPTAGVVVSRRELRTRSASRSSSTNNSVRGTQRGVRDLRRSSRSSSPIGALVHNVPNQPEDASIIPGAFLSGHSLKGDDVPVIDTQKQRPVKSRRLGPDVSHVVPARKSSRTSSPLPPPSEPPVMTTAKIGNSKVASELERLHPAKLAALTEAVLPEMTCDVCYQLFYDPVTTPCQHVSRCTVGVIQVPPLISHVDLLL